MVLVETKAYSLILFICWYNGHEVITLQGYKSSHNILQITLEVKLSSYHRGEFAKIKTQRKHLKLRENTAYKLLFGNLFFNIYWYL